MPSFRELVAAGLRAPEDRRSGLCKNQKRCPETLHRHGGHPRLALISSPNRWSSQRRATLHPAAGQASLSGHSVRTPSRWLYEVERLSALRRSLDQLDFNHLGRSVELSNSTTANLARTDRLWFRRLRGPSLPPRCKHRAQGFQVRFCPARLLCT